MDLRTCMNEMCRANLSGSVECKRGWILRSGEYACLCHSCWSAYEQSIFCDFFHSKESGWRECNSCGKRLHCGCIASSCLLELLDIGGVKCSSCSKSLGHHTITSEEKPNEFTMVNNIVELQTSVADNQTYGVSADNMELMARVSDGNGFRDSLSLQNDGIYGRVGQIEQDEATTGSEKLDTECPSSSNKVSTSYQHTKLETFKTFGVEPAKGFITERNLCIALGDPSGNLNHFPRAAFDERAHSKTYSSIPQGPQSLRIFPKTPKSALVSELNTGSENIQHLRVARPPAEGRGRNQLLPRYWPRITDQELQQISGDSNCKVVPLFEKILSASDAGRIGRLVLPKACAEAYFPPISQPEGIPLKIQDVKGNEWVFQFRFWPNNNSRMYVLEGVTPCIQSMQLQAGDTVTFSRMDPEEKLVMGFRKASNSVSKQSLTGSTNPQISAITQHLISGCDDSRWENTQMNGNTAIESFMQQAMLVPEFNNTRNIGGKSKRLLIDSQDALELKLTWEEVHDMLQPPSSVRPSVVSVDDHEFEEYEEPPVLGKRSIFIIRTSGKQEQWVQCDDCFKWRRLPVDVVLPSRWTCAENSWDPNRCSCSARDELTPCELENLLIQNKDFRKWKLTTNHGSILENESSRFDAAVSGDPKSSIAATTKHPRHRPGCSCIVCIQPPSGKGKHNSTCNCNVCMTVKRRFKTLMMRKKKRQSDREAEIAQRRTNLICSPKNPSDNDSRQVNIESASETIRKGHIDLNAQSNRREEDSQVDLTTGLSMTSLVQYASLPLETYLKQNGLTSLISEKQTSSGGSHMLSQVIGDGEEHLNEECCLDSEID